MRREELHINIIPLPNALLEAPPTHIAPLLLAIPPLCISAKLQFHVSVYINSVFLWKAFNLNTEFSIVTLIINQPNNIGFISTGKQNVG